MGCGASTTSRLTQDHHTHLEHCAFQATGIETVDEFFDTVEAPLNALIDLNNDINAALDDVFAEVARVNGAFFLHISRARDIDYVLLRAHGSVSPELRLRVKAEDRELSDALDALRAVLDAEPSMTLRETIGTGVNEIETEYSAAKPAVAKVNAALAALRALLPKSVTIDASVRMATDPGADVVYVEIQKAKFADLDDRSPRIVNATFLDVASRANGRAIVAAQEAVLNAVEALLLYLKQHDVDGFELLLRKGKLTMPPKRKAQVKVGNRVQAPAYPTRKQQVALRKLIAAFNTAIVRLKRELQAAARVGSVATALEVVLTTCQQRFEELRVESGLEIALKDAVKLEVTTGESDGAEEDAPITGMGLTIAPPPELNLPPFPDCIPGKARLIYDKLLVFFATVASIKAALPGFKEQIEELIEAAQGIREKAEEEGVEAGELLSAAPLILANMKKVAGARKIFTNIFATFGRIAGEMLKAAEEGRKMEIGKAKA